jgi:hypothetical protein
MFVTRHGKRIAKRNQQTTPQMPSMIELGEDTRHRARLGHV